MARVLPYDESSGLVAELAGHLADFLYTLSEWRTRLSETRNLEEWLDIGQQLVDAFLTLMKRQSWYWRLSHNSGKR